MDTGEKASNTRRAARFVLVVSTFIAVGLFTAQRVTRHAGLSGTPGLQVRLASAMAGLFAGGAAAVLLAIGLATMRRK